MKTTVLLLLLLPFIGFAQDTTIVKSEAKEMKAEPPSAPIAMRWSFLGNHDKAAALPVCDSSVTSSRDRCTAEAILTSIRANLTYDPAEGDTPNEQDPEVEITFTVNEFGEVKGMKVDYSGDPRISQSIFQALYALPRFTPAQKGGASVGSKIMVAYPYTAIFR